MGRLQDPNEWASSFSAIGFSQFYKKRVISRKKMNPVLMGSEAKKQGVLGFGAELYCPYCDASFDFVLVEFDGPGSRSSLAWGELDLEEFGVDLLRCPKCGNRELVMEIM